MTKSSDADPADADPADEAKAADEPRSRKQKPGVSPEGEARAVDRHSRQAAALRENLRRRKAQHAARPTDPPPRRSADDHRSDD